ncbi:hypothetical protein MVEN_00427400 [Mycena venus]|uniref:Uncharacterized protein n=1 Tax=Mycena venus TaxID=2733690 RepID=A0A8H6YWD5_9AGAR|nr:hypothetical protein MVEN_00427400 [Mycena venus]
MPIQTQKRDGRWTFILLRDLCTMVALCYFITLALLRLIAIHLDFFSPPVSCAAGNGAEYRAYQRVLENISHFDVLKVTTVCSLVAFAALELCALLARRAGMACETGDVECGGSDAVQSISTCPVPEKQLEKQQLF